MAHDQKRAWVAEVSLRREARAKREKRSRPASFAVNAGTARRSVNNAQWNACFKFQEEGVGSKVQSPGLHENQD